MIVNEKEDITISTDVLSPVITACVYRGGSMLV